jgi:Protein of unknown function (DUF2865)
MTRSFLLRSLVALLALGAGEAALAQSAQCQRYQAELAALDQGGGNQAAATAERQRAELVRLVSYYKSIGCERSGPFGGLFGGGAVPAECGPIQQRIRVMESNYDRLRAQVQDLGGAEARRRQLVAAIEQTCNAPQRDAFAGPRGFFESLFGRRGPGPEAGPAPGEGMPEEEPALGGGRLVCVRTCDGFAFPLGASPGNGREGADELCQALCPGAETAAFSAPGGDESLDHAISLRGVPYRSLPTAFKFQKTFDASCTCKKEGESWAQVLNRAESLLGQRGDIIVTAQKAEELSRAKAAANPAAARKADPKRPNNDAAEAQAAADGAAAPTASQESAGIGPNVIESSRVVAKGEGRTQEIVTSDGTKRAVRVVAPNLIPVPVPESKTP